MLSVMLNKLGAFVLLTLALSPFNAPFQTGGGNEHQVAQIEPLSAIRQHSACRAVAQHPEVPDAFLAFLPESVFLIQLLDPAAIANRGPASTGESFLAAVLRL